MWPECALCGTATTSPRFELCRCAEGERLLIFAPGLRGKAMTMPLFRPLPCNASRPRMETSRELALQLFTGTQ